MSAQATLIMWVHMLLISAIWAAPSFELQQY